MSDLIKRMKATAAMEIVSAGELFERTVAEQQFVEAIQRIEELEIHEHLVETTAALNVQNLKKIEELKTEILELKAKLQLQKRNKHHEQRKDRKENTKTPKEINTRNTLP